MQQITTTKIGRVSVLFEFEVAYNGLFDIRLIQIYSGEHAKKIFFAEKKTVNCKSTQKPFLVWVSH
jgi:hypothetical protein